MNINGIFNPENRFFTFMDKVMNLCFLGILWALFSLPVITIGASTTALFQYTLKLIRNEEGYVWRSFRKSFVKNFVPATLLWLGGGRPVFNIGFVLLPVPAFPGGNKMGGQGCFGKSDICLFINNNLLISIDCLFPVFYKEDSD